MVCAFAVALMATAAKVESFMVAAFGVVDQIVERVAMSLSRGERSLGAIVLDIASFCLGIVFASD